MAKRKPYVERPTPSYRVIALLLHYSYHNEYPKNAHKFVWGIPARYTHVKDREVSAIVTSYLYDGTPRSIKAIEEVHQMFKGEPFGWLAKNGHHDMLMTENQERHIYGRITITDLYWFFREVYTLYTQYRSVYRRFKASSFDTLQENMECALSVLTPFKGKDIVGQNRRNMFFFLMAHCYNDYLIDESQLIAPLYAKQLDGFERLNLLPKDTQITKDAAVTLTDNLRWFSENHPLTYWVGVHGYIEALRIHDSKLTTIPKQKLTRHRFNKK